MAEPRLCSECGGEVRFSHVEYAGRGEQRVVLRCRGCGRTVSGGTRAAGEGRRSSAKAKAPVNDGPPQNTVLDSDLARRLLEGLRPDGE